MPSDDIKSDQDIPMVANENLNATNFQVVEGSRLPVKMRHTTREDGEEWPLAEILSIRHLPEGSKQYYVHFIEYNKRLDEWVTEDRLNFSHIEPPKPKDQDKTNVNTPKRSVSASAASSRPSTPPATTESGIFEFFLAFIIIHDLSGTRTGINLKFIKIFRSGCR